MSITSRLSGRQFPEMGPFIEALQQGVNEDIQAAVASSTDIQSALAPIKADIADLKNRIDQLANNQATTTTSPTIPTQDSGTSTTNINSSLSPFIFITLEEITSLMRFDPNTLTTTNLATPSRLFIYDKEIFPRERRPSEWQSRLPQLDPRVLEALSTGFRWLGPGLEGLQYPTVGTYYNIDGGTIAIPRFIPTFNGPAPNEVKISFRNLDPRLRFNFGEIAGATSLGDIFTSPTYTRLEQLFPQGEFSEDGRSGTFTIGIGDYFFYDLFTEDPGRLTKGIDAYNLIGISLQMTEI
jgi:hypothetical protein